MKKFVSNEVTKKLAKRIFLEDLNDCLKFPKYFEIESIRACNARCIMCTVNQWKVHENPLMNFSLFEKIVEEMKNYSDWIEIVCFNRNGEPTLDKTIAQKVLMLKQIGIKKVRLITNGALMNSKLSESLLNSGIDEVMFSIDSIKKSTYEKIRKGLKFDVVLRNILRYIEIRNNINTESQVTLRMIQTDENIREQEEWIKFWKNKIEEHDKAYIMPMHSWGNQLVKEGYDKIKKFEKIPCISPFSTMVIFYNGKVGLCGADYKPLYNMGDVTKNLIYEIWNNEKFNSLRIAHLTQKRNKYELCRGCDIWFRKYKYHNNMR